MPSQHTTPIAFNLDSNRCAGMRRISFVEFFKAGNPYKKSGNYSRAVILVQTHVQFCAIYSGIIYSIIYRTT
ncbi:hypothetical protein LPB67_17930 [Undibacterium sp. Jales W-56]|uniref:hypothetical protein n=1 Tax=Undibacterium sp. Jales W-56 TaxID=2897325 RepID=UPI0021D2CE93|nr:hypothetical protein [Undibacterium sp. Jales W-56]MCU6435660.1 hypothetical protein [Undibacterium sp. Jales W-56]